MRGAVPCASYKIEELNFSIRSQQLQTLTISLGIFLVLIL